mgnify:CR=1 FL=1
MVDISNLLPKKPNNLIERLATSRCQGVFEDIVWVFPCGMSVDDSLTKGDTNNKMINAARVGHYRHHRENHDNHGGEWSMGMTVMSSVHGSNNYHAHCVGTPGLTNTLRGDSNAKRKREEV